MTHDFESEESDTPSLKICMDNITEKEVQQAVKRLKNGKAAGIHQIQPELLEYSSAIIPELTNLCNNILKNKAVPSDWRNGIIIPLPKKGDLTECDNWRGTTLLSVPGKVFCSVLLERIRVAVDSQLRQEQAGFRRGRSCNDQIFTLRQIIEKVTAWQRPVMMNFVDFTKAFDSVHRPSLWRILNYGFPSDIIDIIQNLYHEGQSTVKWSGTIAEWFKVMTGVRQGCILSPALFALAIDWVVRTTLNGLDVGLQWTDGNRLSDLDYADDIVLLETSHGRMQQVTEIVETAGKKIGLLTNGKKCKTLVSDSWEDSREIRIRSTEVENVDDFCYLGSWLSTNGNCDKNCQTRIGKASSVFGRLQDVWRNKHLKVKVRLYESLVMSTMLYSAELWPLTIPQKKSWMPPTTSFNDDSWVLHRKTKCAMKTSEIRRNYKEWTSSSRKED